MKIVIVESPFSNGATNSIEHNVLYGLNICRTIVDNEEDTMPFASHLYYPYFLDDDNFVERDKGIQLGLEFAKKADEIRFYIDRGLSQGMMQALLAYSKWEEVDLTFESIEGNFDLVEGMKIKWEKYKDDDLELYSQFLPYRTLFTQED